jgi:hypothetical protein
MPRIPQDWALSITKDLYLVKEKCMKRELSLHAVYSEQWYPVLQSFYIINCFCSSSHNKLDDA